MGATAADVIAAAKGPQVLLSDDSLHELRLLCEHNDNCRGNAGRVSWHSACDMLASRGEPIRRVVLERVCRERLGRKSWARR